MLGQDLQDDEKADKAIMSESDSIDLEAGFVNSSHIRKKAQPNLRYYCI